MSNGIDNNAASAGAAANKHATVKFKPVPIDMPSSSEHRPSDNNIPKTPTSPTAGYSGAAPFTPRDDGTGGEYAYEKKKIGHRRFDKQTGEITYKKFPTSEIMGAIQLGITNSVGSLASKPYRDVLMQDFTVVETVYFPREGSNVSPSHPYSDFRFKSYAPMAFRYFRELFEIRPEDFLASLTEPLRELSNPGASGSIFYISCDDQFIIKTVQHKEADFLQKLLPGYYMNLNQNARTLLPKFFGLYCYQCLNKNVRLLVMNNLLPSSIRIHDKFDLKGSTYKRRASKYERTKDSPTLKDLDFLEDLADGIFLEHSTYDALIKTISRDCRVLESFKIMDYSLLVGIHNIDQALRDHEEQEQANQPPVSESDVRVQMTADGYPTKIDPSQRKIVRQKTVFSTWDSIQPDAAPVDLDDEYPAGGIPARNNRGDRLLLFLGIIDILQSYQLFKKLEHRMKSLIHDGDTISVHKPSFYAQRFQDFMKVNVFKKTKSPFKHSPNRKKQQRRGTASSIDERYHKTSTSASDIVPIPSARADSIIAISSPNAATTTATPSGGIVATRRSIFETPRSSTLPRWDTVDGSPPTKETRKVERLFATADKRNSGPTLLPIEDQQMSAMTGRKSSSSNDPAAVVTATSPSVSPKLRPPLETNL